MFRQVISFDEGTGRITVEVCAPIAGSCALRFTSIRSRCPDFRREQSTAADRPFQLFGRGTYRLCPSVQHGTG